MEDLDHSGNYGTVFPTFTAPQDRASARFTDSSSITTPPSLTSESSPESYLDNEDPACLSAIEQVHDFRSKSINAAVGGTANDALYCDWPANTPCAAFVPKVSDELKMTGVAQHLSAPHPNHKEAYDAEQFPPSQIREHVTALPMETALSTTHTEVHDEKLMSPDHSSLQPMTSSDAPFSNHATAMKPMSSFSSSPHHTSDTNSIAPAMIEKNDKRLLVQSPPHMPSSATDTTSLSLMSTRAIWPDRENLPSDMKILVNGLPAAGAKSRVETQIRMRIELVHPVQQTDGHVEYERIGSFTHIKVPPLSGTKRKSRKHQKTCVPPESTLMLEADVINATPPHARVYVCDSCRERERKRAHRKKSRAAVLNAYPTEEEMTAMGINPHAPDALSLAVTRLEEEERKHAVLFNCGDYIDFHDGEVILSTRITCYCRHHREKVGFHIVFTLRNHKGDFIATGSTPPIMIMDDHKSMSNSVSMSRMAEARLRSGIQDETFSPPRLRERAKPYDERLRRSSVRETPQPSAFLPSPSPVMHMDSASSHLSFPLNDHISMSWVNSMSPPSADEPVSSIPLMHDTTVPSPLQVTAPSNLFPPLTLPSDDLDMSAPVPRITKLVPVEGPTTGGVEITILGANFREGLQCVFGDMPSTSTRVWSPTTLVCILPPSFRPGPVIVRIQDSATSSFIELQSGHPIQIFTYIDTTDRALMELALQVVGMQMTGQVASARDIAMRIVSTCQGGSDAAGSASTVPTQSSKTQHPIDLLSSCLRLTPDSRIPSVQDSLLGLLKLLDVDLNDLPDQQRPPCNPIHACNRNGHTLLHLAVIHNFHRLVLDLLRRGCPIHARDANGYTALHFAALHGWMEVTKLLLQHGADIYDANNEGLIPIEVAHRSEKIDVERMLADSAGEDHDPSYADYGDETSDEDDDSETEEEWITFADVARTAGPVNHIHHTEESEEDKRVLDSAPSFQPKSPTSTPKPPWDSEVKSPGPIHSPPPTYDEATTQHGEPGSSKYIDGEKLISFPSALENAQTQNSSVMDGNLERELKLLRRGRRNARLARQRRWDSMDEPKDQQGAGAETVLRTRQGVYDDRMLVWFWIPAMLLAILVPILAQTGWFSSAVSTWIHGIIRDT